MSDPFEQPAKPAHTPKTRTRTNQYAGYGALLAAIMAGASCGTRQLPAGFKDAVGESGPLARRVRRCGRRGDARSRRHRARVELGHYVGVSPPDGNRPSRGARVAVCRDVPRGRARSDGAAADHSVRLDPGDCWEGRPADPAVKGKPAYWMHVMHAGGVLQIPADLYVRSDDVYRLFFPGYRPAGRET